MSNSLHNYQHWPFYRRARSCFAVAVLCFSAFRHRHPSWKAEDCLMRPMKKTATGRYTGACRSHSTMFNLSKRILSFFLKYIRRVWPHYLFVVPISELFAFMKKDESVRPKNSTFGLEPFWFWINCQWSFQKWLISKYLGISLFLVTEFGHKDTRNLWMPKIIHCGINFPFFFFQIWNLQFSKNIQN